MPHLVCSFDSLLCVYIWTTYNYPAHTQPRQNNTETLLASGNFSFLFHLETDTHSV